MKLAVGARTLADLQDWQARRGASHPPLRHQTRNMPRRAGEILPDGSLYWVIAGQLAARQRMLAIAAGTRDDGAACTDFFLDPALVLVRARPVKPFQGWRYLEAADAPADLGAWSGEAEMPETLRRELAAAGLL